MRLVMIGLTTTGAPGANPSHGQASMSFSGHTFAHDSEFQIKSLQNTGRKICS